MTRERALALVLVIATALAFYLCYRLVLPFLPALAWALALAVVAHPLHEWIARRIHQANIAAGLSVIIVTIILVAPALFVTERLVREAASGVEIMNAETATGRWRAAVERNPRLAPILHWVETQIDVQGEAQRAVDTIISRLSSFVTGSIWMIVELMITLFTLFFFFRDRRAVLRAMRSLVPLSEPETDEVFSRVADTISATIYGTLVVAFVQGALGGLMFWWLGLPAPLLWGVVMALLAIVPVLGPFVVWVPAAIFLALEGNWGKALILTALGVGVIAVIDNLLYPMLVGKKMRLHTLPVFFAILGGLALFGPSGLILGPVTLAITVALVDVWRRRTAGGRAAEEGVKV
ncbi:MAG TPA: AI-2E family transporter [Blastocatellia bacterium]|nr:AI-2E family transporter [Blastocatellia bacterium]